MKVRVTSSYSQLERWGWTAVKATFVAVVLSLVLNPTSKGRSERASTGSETVLPARIGPGDLYTISAEAGGKMVELHVQPGDAVQAGQLLGVIENPELESLIGRAARRVELAEARLSARDRPAARGAADSDPQRQWLQEQLTAAERNLEASWKRLEQFSLDEAEQAHARAVAAAERVRGLAARQLATAREVEDADRSARNELRNLNARREQRGRLEQELNAAGSHARMARLQMASSAAGASTAATPADAVAAQLDYDDAVAAHKTLVDRKAALRMVARRPGTVLQVNAAAGEAVPGGAVIFQIANTSTLHFDVSAQATVARSIAAGQRVLVRVPLDPPFDVPAAVSRVLLQPDPNQHAYLIRVTIPNPAPHAMLVGLEGGITFPH